MGPNNGELDPLAIPTERALAFISKSIEDVQRSAKSDFKLMSARAESLRHLTSNIDEWENIKLPIGSGKEVSAAKLLRKLHDSSKALTRPITFEESQLFKKLKQQVAGDASKFHRSFSDPNLFRSDWSKSFSTARASSARGIINLESWESGKGTKKWHVGTEEWEPLKRVKEGLKELEVTAAKSSSPSEFFEKVKKNLKIAAPKSPAESFLDVSPLDAGELLEKFIRESEPFLDQFGVKSEVISEKVRGILGKNKKLSGVESVHISDSAVKDELSDRITSVMKSTGYKHGNEFQGPGKAKRVSRNEEKKQKIAIFTTASLPWMTGTAVNPLFRAAYLALKEDKAVTLLVPWLAKSDQRLVYPNQMVFDSPSEQEQYVRDWICERVGFSPDFKIAFYPGKFSTEKRSILAVGDISSFVSEDDADIAVLEEPEHLTWYYHGQRWTDKFKRVIGIVHTNYLEYVRREKNGPLQAFILEHLNNWMVKCYCHKVVRLSAATQDLPKSMVCNVHGVGARFLEVGKSIAQKQQEGNVPFTKGAYYLGKMVWSKGYRELVDLISLNKQRLPEIKLDVYGSGEDSQEVQKEAAEHDLPISFFNGRDHGDPSLHQYKVFINPSLSDVVCTTTAEALAMGKIVVCADHPSNEFFRKFPNCYMYRNNEEFVQKVSEAMAAEPLPLSDDQQHALSWESATERFLECAGLNSPSAPPSLSPPSSSLSLSSPSSSPSLSSSCAPISTLSSPSSPKTQSLHLPNPFDDGADMGFGSTAGGFGSLNHQGIFSLSLALPSVEETVDRALAFTHYMASGVELARHIVGAPPDSMHCGSELSKDLGLPPPLVQRPVYGW